MTIISNNINVKTGSVIQLSRNMAFDISDVNIAFAPGIAGSICTEISETERRALPGIRPLTALMILAIIGENYKTVFNSKISLYAIGIAPSGGGKDAQLSFIKEVASAMNLTWKMSNKPRSDKSLMTGLIDGGGSPIIIADEAHAMFNKATNSNASSFDEGIIVELLEMATSTLYPFPKTLKSELFDGYSRALDQAEKALKSETNPDKAELIKNKVAKFQKIVRYIEHGWPNPCVNLIGFSTPGEIDKLFNKRNIESGLLGRLLILRGSENRSKSVEPSSRGPSNALIKRLANIKNRKPDRITFTPEAELLMLSIREHFDKDELLNHPSLGAIYARGVERISLISSLLALETLLIDGNVIKYAYALFETFVSDCQLTLRSDINANFHHASKIAKAMIIKNAPPIGTALSTVLQGVKRKAIIKEKLKSNPEFVDLVLEELLKDGHIQIKDTKGGKKLFRLEQDQVVA